MMKQSIFKKLVAAIATVAMVITSTAVVFAENEYVSVSSECDGSKTGWLMSRAASSYDQHSASAKKVTFLTPGETNGQIPSDGPFGMQRQIFKINKANAALYGLDESYADSSNEIWYHANSAGTAWEAIDMTSVPYGADGNYFFQYSTGGNSSTYATESGITTAPKFTTGVIQAKFDFAFGGDARQCISVGFTDRRATVSGAGFLGARIYRNNIRFWYPTNDGTSEAIYFNEEKTDLGCGTSDYTDAPWYTAVLSYDMDAKVISLSIKSRDDDSFSFTRSFSVKDTDAKTYIGSYYASGINNVSFASYRGIDQSVVSTTPSPASSLWYIDNVSLDAYSETNYELANSYTSGDGIKSNAPATGFTVDGISLSRLTNVADPANASLITAAYDADGRMVAAQSKSLSQVGADAEDVTVTGNTIKSFILDMETANPYIDVFTGATPATTVREIDFEDGFVLNSFTSTNTGAAANGAGGLTQLHGYNTAVGHTMSVATEADGNKALKSERTRFRGSSIDWWYDSETSTYKSSSNQNATHGGYFVKLDEEVSGLKGSLRFKFDGGDVATTQEIQINVGTDEGNASENFIRIRRNAVTGTGQMRTPKNSINWTGTMVAGEWYTLDFEITGTNFVYTLTGNGISETNKTIAQRDSATTFNYIVISSFRNWDNYISAVPTEGTTASSVWYIDDIKLEY